MTLFVPATLIAATKNHDVAELTTLFNKGQHAFAENYLQEALQKQQALSHLPIEWHFIGHIQSNKAAQIATHFAWVQSVDSLKIAQLLNAHRPTNLPPLNILIQVKLDPNPRKSGIDVPAIADFWQALQDLPNLKCRGLMAYPDPKSPEQQLHQYQTFAQTFHHLNQSLQAHWDTLSMGTSPDYQLAIHAGATMVRLGSILFGEGAK